jgi:hypothetical protein
LVFVACEVRKLIRRPEVPLCSEIVFTLPAGDDEASRGLAEKQRASPAKALVGGDGSRVRRRGLPAREERVEQFQGDEPAGAKRVGGREARMFTPP